MHPRGDREHGCLLEAGLQHFGRRAHGDLINPEHAHALRGRKTDVKDAEWLADLLRHGLLKPSFIPPPEIRELRELTRYRESLVREQTAVANRIQKVIESANLKLAQVATDALGASGRAILWALARGKLIR